jgi:hypothetical protein
MLMDSRFFAATDVTRPPASGSAIKGERIAVTAAIPPPAT